MKYTKLQFVGIQKWPNHEPIRLWNVLDEQSPFHQSTRSLEGLQDMGIVPQSLAQSTIG